MRHEEDNVMARHQVRRVPVVENGRLVGIVAQVDIARTENEKKTGQPVEAISERQRESAGTSPVAGLRIT
jgi:CBS domain-containing protein